MTGGSPRCPGGSQMHDWRITQMSWWEPSTGIHIHIHAHTHQHMGWKDTNITFFSVSVKIFQKLNWLFCQPTAPQMKKQLLNCNNVVFLFLLWLGIVIMVHFYIFRSPMLRYFLHIIKIRRNTCLPWLY